MPKSWSAKIAKNWFLIGLVVVLAVGHFLASPIHDWLGGSIIRIVVVAMVMFFMALGISWQQIVKSFMSPVPALLGAVINMLFIPAIALLVSTGLDQNLSGGLLVAACIPCTLASSAVWTRRGGGDDTIAVLVMVITNGTCFITTPILLGWLLGADLQIAPWGLMRDLAIVVLLPITLAQIVGSNDRVRRFADRRKGVLGAMCQSGILLMVMLGAAQMELRVRVTGQTTSMLGWIAVLGAVIVVHLAAIITGWFTAKMLGMTRPQQVAVSISGSQKTLMIGLKIAIDTGVSVLPMVAYHVSQLLIDTLIVDWWKRHENRKSSQEGPVDRK